MKNILLLSFFFIMIVFYSCEKEKDVSPNMGYNYFPTEIGSWISYRVDSIYWDENFLTVDTFLQYVKLEIDSVFTDGENRKSYRWAKYSKSDSTDWALNKVYYITPKASGIETFEENIRYNKIIFPVRLGKTWDLNAYNTDNNVDCRFIDVDIPKTISFTTFDSCAIVQQWDLFTFIRDEYGQEIYARDIGLVYKYQKMVNKSDGEIIGGFEYSYQYLDHGKN